MPIRATIRLRLTLWYVLLLAVILGAFAVGVYLFLRHSLYQDLDNSLQNSASALLNVIQYEGDSPVLPGQGSLRDPNQDDHFVRIFNTSGEIVFDNSLALGQVPIDLDAVTNAVSRKSDTRSVSAVGDDDAVRIKTLPIFRDGLVVGVLEVGQTEDDVSEALANLLIIMVIEVDPKIRTGG